MLRNIARMIVIMMMLVIAGCESSDHRLARMAEATTREQAQQNERLAEQHHEIAQASRQLIEADAQVRAEFHELTQDLNAERLEITRQRDRLEDERKQLAAARQRDPVIASAILQIGVGLLCLLPLLVCIYVLRAVTQGSGDENQHALTELLVLDITSEQPLLLPRPEHPVIGQQGCNSACTVLGKGD